jgi:hypothetical protein
MPEVNKVGEGYTAPSPAVQDALSMPIENLEAQMKAMESGNEQTPSNPDSTTSVVTPIVPVQVGQVPQVEETKQVDAPPVVETPVVPGSPTFAELQAKKGFTSPDALAKSYTALEKEFQKMKQAEAAARVAPVQPQSIPTNPSNGESNFLNELLEKPEQTIANAFLKLNSIVNAEQVDKINSLQRKLKFEEMAANPETADFSDPEIQAQMQEEFKSHPQWMADVNTNLEDAYYVARGKVKAKAETRAFEQGKIAGEQSIQAKKGAMVEGSSAVGKAPVVDTNPMTMPLTDLEQMLKSKLG